jgi:phosphoribosyl-AMP cyclohydrolase
VTVPDSPREPVSPIPQAAGPLIAALKWSADGLVPAIVQDVESGEVLMMAWMDESALRKTLATGQTHFYSRSRRTAWHKGETSGHIQEVAAVLVDCDADVVLIKARQVGGACHEGYHSCFFRRVGPDGQLEVVAKPVFEADVVYRPRPAEAAQTPRGETAE